MDPAIYNQPLRRDIIHNVYKYFRNLNNQSLSKTLTRGDVSGSGKKMRAQKKTGRAR